MRFDCQKRDIMIWEFSWALENLVRTQSTKFRIVLHINVNSLIRNEFGGTFNTTLAPLPRILQSATVNNHLTIFWKLLISPYLSNLLWNILSYFILSYLHEKCWEILINLNLHSRMSPSIHLSGYRFSVNLCKSTSLSKIDLANVGKAWVVSHVISLD